MNQSSILLTLGLLLLIALNFWIIRLLYQRWVLRRMQRKYLRAAATALGDKIDRDAISMLKRSIK